MVYVRVHVDVDDVLEELSDDDLRSELSRRTRRRGNHSDEVQVIDRATASTALDDASTVLRKCGRVDLAYKLDETRIDYFTK